MRKVDGVDKSEKVDGFVTGADTGATVIRYTFPAANFACFDEQPPPNPPKPTPLPEPLGKACSPSDACPSMSDPSKGNVCCGIAIDGKVLKQDGETTTTYDAPNAVICNYAPGQEDKPADYVGELVNADGTMSTFLYPGSKFTCSGTRLLYGTLSAAIAIASLI